MTQSKTKAVLIGLDGAPYPQIRQWVGEGFLPNLAKMIQEGVFGMFESSVHPISPIAWNTIVTGQNAGKHGVYDFGKRCVTGYDFDLVNSFTRKAPALWDYLNQAGCKAGIFNVPVTYPPLAISGYMVSGLLTPNRDSAFTYPADLAKQIIEWAPEYRVPGEDAIFIPGKEVEFVEQLIQSIAAQEVAVLKLIDRYPDMDFHMFVFMQGDHLHHKLWKYIKENQTGSPILKAIKKLYARLDEAVGKIQKKFEGQPVTFFVASDHGGGSLDKIVSLNRWLMGKGWLKLKPDFWRPLKKAIYHSRIFEKAYGVIRALGLGRLAKLLPMKLQENIATSFSSFNDVDWTQTQAYASGKYGQIYINLKGREPQGCVDSGDEYEKLREEIAAELLTFEDPETGEKIVKRVFKSQELYHGPYASEAADLIFAMADYRYDSSTDFGFLEERIFREPEFQDTGTHRLEGILLAAGPFIKKGVSLTRARLEDLAPTILAILNQPVPAEMDGKCLEEALSGLSPALSQTAYPSAYDPIVERAQLLSEKEKEEIENRLRSLGYLG